LASGLKGEFKGEGSIVIIKIRKPKGVREAFEKELKKLADILIDGNS
jgi:hypothetical protein